YATVTGVQTCALPIFQLLPAHEERAELRRVIRLEPGEHRHAETVRLDGRHVEELRVSRILQRHGGDRREGAVAVRCFDACVAKPDRKSTRLNSSHGSI